MPRAAVLALALVAASPAFADPTPAPSKRVPLHDNFPWWEIAGIGGLIAGNVVLKTYEYDLAAARGAPLIGDPPGFDKAISNALYPGPFAQPFLLHAPELVMTEAGPVVYMGLYGIDSLSLWFRGHSLSGAANPDHKLLALAESLFLDSVVNLAVKVSVGRERPFEALHRYGSDPGQAKTTLSFFSNQSSNSFTLVAFAWRDLSDWLTSGPMEHSSDGTRLWLGRVVPGVVLFTAGAWDGYSRIVDQRHWFSDVVVGSAVGTAIGYFTYAYHFDWNGQPKRRWRDDHQLRLVPSAGGNGAALTGVF